MWKWVRISIPALVPAGVALQQYFDRAATRGGTTRCGLACSR
jgi:hypothetical protein